MSKEEKALRWIVGILNEAEIPFQIVGGLAARAYGATRPLVDIDMYIPADGFPDLIPFIKDFIVFGPEHFRDESWDIVFLAMDYEEQRIEIGDADRTLIFDRRTRQWVKETIDFSRSVRKTVFGVTVPVMSREELIAYKKRLSRAVDVQDIQEMDDSSLF